MKDEYQNTAISIFLDTGSKAYYTKSDKKETKTAKGVNKQITKKLSNKKQIKHVA